MCPMPRRFRLILALLVAWCCFAPVSVEAAAKPNILWISAEDISPHLGCYGYPHAVTPVLDGLAEEGVRYTNACVTAGVCAPCRSTIITGVYQTTLGTQHMRCKAQLPAGMRLFPEYLRDAGYFCTNNSKTDYQLQSTPKETWDDSSKKAHWRNRPDPQQPFFSVFNYTGCHESGIANDTKYENVTKDLPADHRHRAEDLTLPPYYPDTPIVREDWKRYYDVISALDQFAGKILKQLDEDGLSENTIVFFWSDHGVGLPRAKRWLYDSGMRIPLIVRIPQSLRQDGQGKPGTVCDRLVSTIDFGPTMLNLAGVKVPDYMQGYAFLGANPPPPREYVFGARDRMDERYDIIRAVRDKRFKYIRNYEPFKTYYQYMNTPEKGATMKEIRRVAAAGELSPAAKLFMAPNKPVEELYDLKNDPHELQNLADNPKYEDVLTKMRKVHLNWVLKTRDLGLIPEPEIIEREKELGSRYDILGNDQQLVFRLRDAASTALEGESSIPKMLKFMDDADAAVRYWGTIGLGNLGEEAVSARTRLIAALKDNSASVRIAAARALSRMGCAVLALPVLEKELRSPEEWVRLNAAIVLDEMDEDARPLISALKEALNDKQNKYVVRVANRALNELEGTDNVVP